MKAKKVASNFYEVVDSNGGFWTCADTKDGPFICNKNCRVVSNSGALGKRIIAAVNAIKGGENDR